MRTIYVTKSPKAALNVSLFGKVDSTNNVIRNDINYGHFDFVIAEMQTHGRGRGDNVFISEMGGLYMSVLLEDDGEMTDYITPLAGVAVAKTLIEYGFEPRIKWVNDVFVHGKKIAGILAERVIRRGKLYIILGIGLNVGNASFGEYGEIATSMALQRPERRRVCDVAAVLIDNLNTLIKTGEKKDVMNFYRKHSLISGKQVEIVETGERVLAMTIDEKGRLIIKRDSGSLDLLSSGSVRLV